MGYRRNGADCASDLGINTEASGQYIEKPYKVRVLDGQGYDDLCSFETKEEQMAFVSKKIENGCEISGTDTFIVAKIVSRNIR